MESIFFEISLVLIFGTLFGTFAKLLKQPMIPAYILAGVILGPSVLHIIREGELLEALSTFGIAFLLFLVGMELDIRKFFKTSKVAFVVGTAQMIFAAGIGYVIIRLLGFTSSAAIFLAVALAFSSTIVVLKLLGERKETDSLYGQIVIGIMLTQDFFAVTILILFTVFTGDATGTELIANFFSTIVKAVLMFTIALISSKYILNYAFKYFARSNELLVLGSICWCLVFAILSVSLGFSIEVGALLAGVSLSYLPYTLEISHRVKSIRDFFLPIFFAVLGGQLVFSGASQIFTTTAILSTLVVVVSPMIVLFALLWFGYRSRPSFKAAIAIGQISEFSFILVHLGFTAGIVEHDIVSLVALIGLVTMTLSSYMIEYADWLYQFFRPILKKFERSTVAERLELLPDELINHAVLFGYSTMGYKIREMFEKLQVDLVVIDHNPDIIQKLQLTKIPHFYGSISDDEVLEKAKVKNAQYIVSTIPYKEGTVRLLDYIKDHQIKSKVIVVAFSIDDAIEYYSKGADFVIHPTSISADFLKDVINTRMDAMRKSHIKELMRLKKIGSVT